MPLSSPAPALATLFDHLADSVYLLDPDTSHIVWCNRAGWESLGLTPEAVLDHSVLSLQMDVAGQPQWSDIAAVIRGTPCYAFVGRHRHADGREIPVEVHTTRLVDGGREYFLSVARDLSRRLLVEAGQRSRGEQLSFALNEALDGLWDWDLPSGRVYFSPQLQRMLGYGPDEMAPTLETWSRNVHPEDAERVLGALNDHLQGRRSRYEAEYRLRNRNGGHLWVMDRGRSCEFDERGRPVRVVGMVQDVTREREARNALARLEQEHRALIQALPDVIARIDREGRYRFVSDNVGQLVPLAPSQVVGRTHAELGFPDHLCRLWDGAIQGVFATGEPHESEFVVGEGEQARAISWRVVPERDAAGTVCHALTVCRDITARRRVEAELERHRHHLEDLVAERTAALNEAKTAAEAASRAKSRFLATMSHELRTPIGAILGMTHLALQQATEPTLRDQLGKAVQASRHLLSLINDILDLSKIEAERMVLEATDFALGSVFESLQHLVAHRAVEKGLALRIEMPPSLADRTVNGDPLRLKQVLLNLTDNAIKFSERGEVRVCVKPGEPDARGALPLRVEIHDQGIGIDGDTLDRLFVPFEQADNSTTRRFGGTGLGLAISRRLVQLMGGEIGARSTPGQGSQFWFELVLSPPTGQRPVAVGPAPGPAREALRRAHGGCRVLLADDDVVGREIATAVLQQAGLQVTAVHDGREALERARESDYGLIVLDMQMPNLNGLDAARAIRAEVRHRRTPIIAVTANAFDDDRERCLQAGMDAHLTKPLDPETLYRVVHAELDRVRGMAADTAP